MSEGGASPAPALRTVWLDKDIHARRLLVLEVTATHVVSAVSYLSGPGAFDHPDRTTRIQRRYWHRRYTPEGGTG